MHSCSFLGTGPLPSLLDSVLDWVGSKLMDHLPSRRHFLDDFGKFPSSSLFHKVRKIIEIVVMVEL